MRQANELGVEAFAQAAVEAVQTPIEVEDAISVRVSIGFVVVRMVSYVTADVLKEADAALYDAKRAGGGRLRFGNVAHLPFKNSSDDVGYRDGLRINWCDDGIQLRCEKAAEVGIHRIIA